MVSRNNSFLQMKIEGAAELEAALYALGNDREIRLTLRRALNNKQAKRMVEFARSLAAKSTGQMAGKFTISTTLSRRQRRQRTDRGSAASDLSAVLFIGAAPRGPAVLSEFGTGPRRQANGKSTGRMPAQPALRPAWETFKDAILAEFAKELWVQIEKSAKRIARRQAKLLRESKQ